MGKFIRDLLLFGCIAIVMYVVLICVWGEWVPAAFQKNLKYNKGSYGHLFTRANEARNTRDVDILVLGSSHAYRGFDPRIFEENGYKLFNLGSSAQSHSVTQGLLERYLDKLDPEVVIYEVWPKTFMNNSVESTLDIVANDSIDLITLELVIRNRNILTTNAFIYGLYNDVIKNGRQFKESVIRRGKDGTDKYVAGGYVEKVEYAEKEPDVTVLDGWRDDQFEYFRENLDLIRRSGARVVLVKAPVRQATYDSLFQINWFNNEMKKYGDYQNYTELLKLEDHYFYDKGHLNQKGVNIFNQQLIEDMRRDQILD